MLVLTAILLGILIGLIRKGKLSGLVKERPRLWAFCLVGLLLQLGLHLLFYIKLDVSLIAIVNFISYVLIIVPLAINYKNIWLIAQAFGFFLNFVVTFINGGLMPVSADVLSGASAALAGSINNGSNAVYMLMDKAGTRLWFLGNFIRIPKIGAVTSLYGAVPGVSIGTIVILIALVGWIQSAMAKHAVRPQSFFEDNANRFEGTHDVPSDRNSGTAFFDDDAENDADFFKMGEAILEDQASMRHQDLTADEVRYMEEEAMTEMTEVIPKLTPEMIAKISKDGTEGSEALTDEEIASGETKVFTAIKNLDEGKAEEMAGREISSRVEETGLFEQDQIIESEAFEDQWWDDDIQPNDRDAYVPQWHWDTPSSNEDLSDMTPEQGYISQEDFFSDIKASDLFEEVTETEEPKMPDWNPQEVERESKQAIREQTANPYSTLFNRTEKKSSKGKSIEEMRDIWHQASVNDRRKQKKNIRGEVPASETSETPAEQSGGTVTVLPQVELVQVSKYEKDRDALAERWDQSRKMPKLTGLTPAKSTERVDSKEVLRQTLSRKSEEKMVEAFASMERKRAGYEKVELDIDGRVVSFWRKKKEQQ